MSITRVHKTKDFTVISNHHFRNKSLSLKAKGLLSLMLSLPDNWDYSIEGLTTLSSDGRTAVKTALQELEKNNYLHRQRIYENGKITDIEYHIFESPKDCECYKENLKAKNLNVENLHIENLKVENKDNKILNKSNTNTKVLVENEQKPKRLNLYDKCWLTIQEFTLNQELRDVLDTFLRMRLEIKEKPMYANQWKGMLNKLKKEDERDWIDIVQQSIDKGWLGFYPLKDKKVKTHKDISRTTDSSERKAEMKRRIADGTLERI